MSELHFALNTDTSTVLAVLGTVTIVWFAIIGHSIVGALSGVKETIQRKNFKLKPEFCKETGKLKWEDDPYIRPIWW
jgi:hypothetical protein